MFQPQRPAVDNQGIKPLPKIDENRAVKKPDATAGRPARAAYDPIELPSSFPSGLFKVCLCLFVMRFRLIASVTASGMNMLGDTCLYLPCISSGEM